MYQEIDFTLLPPHLRHPYLIAGIHYQDMFQILYSKIWNSGFLDSISRNQKIRVLNYVEFVAMREQRMCYTCEEKWSEDHECKNSCLVFFNPFDRDDDMVEEQEEKVEGKEGDLISEGNFVNQCVEADLEKIVVEEIPIFEGLKIVDDRAENEKEKVLEGSVLKNQGCFVDEKGKGELETVVVEEVFVGRGLEGFAEKPERKQDQRNRNGDCIGETCVDQLLSPNVDDMYNVSGNSEIQPRVGEKYQAEKHLSKGHCLVPGLVNGSWSETEERHFLLGLHICGKDLVLVKKLIEDNQSYYGKKETVFGVKKNRYVMSRFKFDPGGTKCKNCENQSNQGVPFQFPFDPGGHEV